MASRSRRRKVDPLAVTPEQERALDSPGPDGRISMSLTYYQATVAFLPVYIQAEREGLLRIEADADGESHVYATDKLKDQVRLEDPEVDVEDGAFVGEFLTRYAAEHGYRGLSVSTKRVT